MNDNTPNSRSTWSRRDFGKLTLAAFGGLAAANVLSGCKSTGQGATDTSLLLKEPHVCRGLNTCKGKGATGENKCAGQGKCATATHHSCAGQNDCKGQGGCGEKPGQNACKGQGKCAVPLKEEAWKKARAAFEKQATAAGMEVGPAPSA